MEKWETANPLADPGWDDLILTHPGATFFHSTAWARVLHATYRAAPCHLVRRGEFHLRDLLPVMEMRSPLTGRRGVSLPFTDQCDPLLHEDTGADDAFARVCQAGMERGWVFWEGRGDWGVSGPSVSHWGHDLKLDRDPDRVFDRFSPAVRRAIRKAEKEGLSVRTETTPESMRAFFELHCQTRRKHGVPPQPVEFFENIQREVLAKEAGFVALASLRNRPVAASVFFHFGSKAIYKFGASDSAFLALRGNNLVMFEAIRWLSRHGIEQLDFGRTSKSNEGLRRFKAGFGAAEREIHTCRYDFRMQQWIGGRDQAQGWHNRVFGWMPLPLLRLAGRLLYRHLA